MAPNILDQGPKFQIGYSISHVVKRNQHLKAIMRAHLQCGKLALWPSLLMKNGMFFEPISGLVDTPKSFDCLAFVVG